MPDTYLDVLRILEENAFTSHEKIAKLLNKNVSEIHHIIKELEETKMIIGYKAVINKDKVFEDKVNAVIEVSVSPERDGGFQKIAKRIYSFPEVRSLFLMSGNFDFLIFIEGNNLKEIANFVATKLSTIDKVQHTATHFMLKTYKKDGLILDESETIERLKVMP